MKSIFFFLMLFPFWVFSQIPLDALYWLRSDTGLLVANNRIAQWNDVRHVDRKVFMDNPDFRPEYIPATGIGNFYGYAAVRFNGISHYLESRSLYPVSSDYSIFMIVRQNGAGTQNIISGNTHAIYYDPPRLLHGDFSALALAPIGYDGKINLLSVHYRESSQHGILAMNGFLGDSSFVHTNFDSTLFIGAYQRSNFFNGDLAEIIIFPRFIYGVERNGIENYLLNKYNIPKIIEQQQDTVFSSIPQSKQFFARDNTDVCAFNIEGSLYAGNFDSISCVLFKDNFVDRVISLALQNNNNESIFSFNHSIRAVLKEHRIEVWLKSSSKDSLIAKRDSLVCGDVLVISGQSNSIFGGNVYTNEFIRTFGGNFSNSLRDTLWNVAQGIQSGWGTSIGAWGMKLAQSLIEEKGIPVCVINGGVGGTTIEQHQASVNNRIDVNTIYGSMLYRLVKSNLSQHVKNLFWYQGESNSNTSNYPQLMQNMINFWKMDFPNLKKVYVVQIRPGCLLPFAHSYVREAQRNLMSISKTVTVETFSSTHLPEHDGCHYGVNGYLRLGKELFRLLNRDFYNETDTTAISAPNIQQCYFTSDKKTEIALVFSSSGGMTAQPDVSVAGINYALKDHIYLNDSTAINKLVFHGDTVFLQLSKKSSAKSIRYLPDNYYNNSTIIYQGPWLVNARGIGALTFDEFPIQDHIPVYTIKYVESRDDIHIYPNPTNERIYLRGNEIQIQEISSLHIKDINGIEIMKFNKSDISAFMDVSSLEAGIYFLIIEFGMHRPKHHYHLVVN